MVKILNLKQASKKFGGNRKLIKACLRLDKQSIPEMKNEDAGNLKNWLKICKSGYGGFGFVIKKRKIAGYYHFEGVRKKTWKKIIQGTFKDGELKKEDITKDWKRVYFIIINVVDKSNKRKRVIEKLNEDILSKLKRSKTACCVWTAAGERWSKRMGFKTIKNK